MSSPSSPLFRIGRSAARRPWWAIGAWLLAAVIVVAASATAGRELEDTFEAPGLDSQRAAELLTAAGADEAGLTARVVLTPHDASATFFDDPAARQALARVQEKVSGLEAVIATSDPAGALAAGQEAAVASGAVSPDGRVALITLQYPVLQELDSGDLAELKAAVASYQDRAGAGAAVQVEAGGDLFFSFEEAEAGTGEMMGLLAAVVVLLVAFGSLIAMGLPIGMALFGLVVGVSSLQLITYLVEIPSWAPVLATMVGLGVGIDYALFLVTRHREHLAAGMGVAESAGCAVATAGRAVVFAGGTVVVSILGLAAAGIPFVTAGGVAVAAVVMIMVAASVTLLPAFLGLAGHRINGFGIPRILRRRARRPAAPGAGRPRQFWQRWGTHVGRHAVAYLVGGTLLLLALAAPVLALRLGFPDEGTLPDSRTERRAYDLVAEGFGPGASGPLVIAVDLAGDPSVVEPLYEAVADDPGIASVAPPRIDADAGVALLRAVATTAPQDEETRATVERLRAAVFPAVLAGSGATAHVGGQTAGFIDLGDRVQERLPLFIASVVVLSFLLLVVVFRSVLVPLKAALLNLLSIGAAYGVLVMVFQWGWGRSLIGLEAPVPIVSFIPMFMFAIVFGLSMDYEVFLLSRVREHYLATGDNDASVVRGLAGTARVITSAALIMVSVFLGFVLGEDPSAKMLGLGLATAVAVDASIVRMVLVPATMKLLGRANWWLPSWLGRLLPAAAPAPGTAAAPTATAAAGTPVTAPAHDPAAAPQAPARSR
ncbi:MMPL family transporter [Streptomyces aidingensis]|uniref:Putative drug exporter of the RND superfamily n=1 Tax=Streptomyces aidingensis TaxID=910347 RepID=A0A1I1UFC0_9ACTN|nr:MMPL family transporter [Streptomyces aidingensis]SFD69546.1 putative drug exporter of the RND superfamily [Streptomyces aidingensis]